MSNPSSPTPSRWTTARSFGWTLLALAVVLGALFSRSFVASQIHFSSDGPLGANMAAYARVPAGYTGMWQDLYWLGAAVGSAFPSVTYALLWVLGPLGFAKFYPPICLMLLGLSAWLFFRQLGFRHMVCLLGALAAALNTGFFSYSCWGLGTLPLTIAAIFAGLAAMATPASECPWLKAALAGLAVGMAVMEGFDSGAILSLYFAAFVVFEAWLETGKPWWKVGMGLARLVVVAAMAGFIATQALTVLIGTQVKGVVGMEQDPQTKAQRWDEATMWSLPKVETLRVVIPGLFGYRMDTPDGGNYWGSVGQKPGVIQSRHSGSGVYCGVLTVVVAFWGFLHSLRPRGVFSERERRMIWFWTGALGVSLLLAWGRHAPFYRIVYSLPYFSTIRNPIKFMHPFSLSLVILFAYGLQALYRTYAEKAYAEASSLRDRIKSWWASAGAMDRSWTGLMLGVLGASVVGWLLYAASSRDLEAFLKQAAPPAELAPAMVRFSLREVGAYILMLGVAIAVVVMILNGALAGSRARWGMTCLLLLMVADFSRANRPWIYYWNHEEKYRSNPIIDILRAKPHEQRVVMLPFQVNEQLGILQQYYHVEWVQHLFPCYNIQTLDVVQEPRAATENRTYRNHFFGKGGAGYVRMLELTGTRYVLALAGGFAEVLNKKFDTNHNRFRMHTAFTVQQAKAGDSIQVIPNPAGPFALLEFTGAMPRASLLSKWQISTNDASTLNALSEPAFNPMETVLVADASNDLPTPAPDAASTNVPAGQVEFINYAPKRIQLKARAAAPAILLLNDKHHPNWTVTVDGQPQRLLRCNYLMRGVYVPPGEHTIEFRFRLPLAALGVSLGGIATAILLLGVLAVGSRRKRNRVAQGR